MSASPTCSRLAVLAIATALVSADVSTLDAQCAMCRTLLATPEGERMAAALRSGIWILLAAPFAAFAVIAVAAVRSRTRLLNHQPLTTNHQPPTTNH